METQTEGGYNVEFEQRGPIGIWKQTDHHTIKVQVEEPLSPNAEQFV